MKELYFLHFIRGISAILVMISHVRSPFFINYENVINPTLFQKGFYFITGLGHQAVILFFVLSGFLVGGSFIKSNINVKNYFISRISRLWTVLIPALLLTLLVDFYFYDPALPFRTPAILSIDTFLGNVFFLQTIYFSIYGTNGSLWSLANEFWYYVLFPFMFKFLSKLRSRELDLVSLFFFVLVLFWLPVSISLLFPVWLIGFVVCQLYEKYSFSWNYFLISFVTFCVVLVLCRFKILEGLISDYTVSLSIALLILTSPIIEKTFEKYTLLRVSVSWLSSISFSLYLFHMPILVLFVSLTDSVILEPDYHVFIMFWCVSLAILLSSWFLWFLFEKHTFKVREILKKLFAS